MSERKGRDITDPEHLGETLGKLRKQYPDMPMHELADMVAPEFLTDYKGDPTVHSVKYRQELKQRAVEGDKFAIAALARMNGNA